MCKKIEGYYSFPHGSGSWLGSAKQVLLSLQVRSGDGLSSLFELCLLTFSAWLERLKQLEAETAGFPGHFSQSQMYHSYMMALGVAMLLMWWLKAPWMHFHRERPGWNQLLFYDFCHLLFTNTVINTNAKAHKSFPLDTQTSWIIC